MKSSFARSKKVSEQQEGKSKPRFKIEKLEERIAPSRHGYHCNKKHPCYPG